MTGRLRHTSGLMFMMLVARWRHDEPSKAYIPADAHDARLSDAMTGRLPHTSQLMLMLCAPWWRDD